MTIKKPKTTIQDPAPTPLVNAPSTWTCEICGLVDITTTQCPIDGKTR